MSKTKLTLREQEIYDYVIQYRREMHCSPSMRDIATGVGLSAVSSVHRYIHIMIDKGWFMPYDGRFCSIAPASEEA